MKKGALATGALALGGAGSAAAQQDGGDGVVGDEGGKALIHQGSFYPAARFTFSSGVVDWSPNVPEVEDNVWSEYNTRMIRWLNTNQTVPLYVAQAANVGEYDSDLGFVADADDDPQQPQLYEMDQEFAPFGDAGWLLTVNFSPVPEEEEDNILENDNWWQDTTEDGGGVGTPTEDGIVGGNETETDGILDGNETDTPSS